MKISDAFPSNFLRADDLQGKQVTVTISEITFEEIGQGRDKEEKLMIAFKGKEKKLVCNKTNANTISKLYGDDTDEWIGKPITLVAREVEFQGDAVWAIRVSLKAPVSAEPTKPSKPAPAKQEPNDDTVEEDDIPF